MSLREALEKVLGRADLSADEASGALQEIVSGDVPPSMISAFLIALRMKGESATEIAGFAQTMRDNAVPVRPKATGLVDTCGTGGDGTRTANISTTAAFVVAGAGHPVAKHGNRALSSSSGSADVLEVLGVRIDIGADQVAQCIDEAGIGFIFAPAFHPAMATVMPVRKELGVRTAFNILGPLTNPARPSFQLVGVGHPDLAGLVAGALAELGTERAVVVAGAGGPDELTCAGPNVVLTVENGSVTRTETSAADVDLDENVLDAIRGGDPSENAELLRAVLEGKPGPVTDCVVFNAGAALVAAGSASDLRDGVNTARDVIGKGDALAALDRLVALCATF
ncbi:MAG TPA: anthranilate phosphoribosyltransferase [Actinomycetota bacterium]|jgi:anthranilate phosphoribosyltransferase|nr:anthranilate phosphoribosyltransferase [Actinomycetota bacterium]